MRIAVVDGQGGGIGKVMVEKLRAALSDDVEIIALGTNASATMVMMRAGANEGATGENALIYNVAKVDIIVGTVGILAANAFLGEMTARMASAVADSPAKKILIPLNKCNIVIVGTKDQPLPHHIECVIEAVKAVLSVR